ncbi:MAG: phage Gp37/Gp68 family protein [Alphaproteobacteria bacterium]|nr:phage Gp37/Gp68 family protein [Alphaproteobacteria bacterium]
MRDIWNPWHGCKKVSEGCQNCYMYFLDSQRGRSGAEIYRVKGNFDYPLHKDRFGNYKIRSGEFLRVCMTSDFFLSEADCWRAEAWEIIRKRSDVIFILVTKRPQRIPESLPDDWGDGWENVWLNVTAENQKRADERIPILLELPFKHKGVLVAPFIGEISLEKYLRSQKIENVWCGGENYDGARPLYQSWVVKLSQECRKNDVTFSFFETGNIFIKNGEKFKIFDKTEQMKRAFSENLNYESKKPQIFNISADSSRQESLFDFSDTPPKFFKEHCNFCAMKKHCAGCSKCGKCSG